MSGTPIKVWGQMSPMPREQFVATVRRFEDAGLEGIWCSQTFGAPFGPLCAAAAVSERVKLGTGIALAFARSPVETACNVMDLDLISGGRAVLGLGSSAQSLTEGVFGMTYGKPLTHMREVIGMIRTLVAKAHTGEVGVLKGEYHTLDLSHFRTLSPPVRTEIPIYLPAVFEKACVMGGEIADGLLGHPLWNERWIHEQTEPNLKAGLDKSGRDRGAVDLNLMAFTVINPDRREAIEDARATIAFYSQSEQYQRYFDYIGFGAEARGIQAAFAANDIPGMAAACTDAMVESIALVGPKDEVRGRIADRTANANSFTPSLPHYGLSPEKMGFYADAIADLLYS
ncbi:MAG: LLM class flavin-dependent oxidoreductase [Janthinobacterium lividum]